MERRGIGIIWVMILENRMIICTSNYSPALWTEEWLIPSHPIHISLSLSLCVLNKTQDARKVVGFELWPPHAVAHFPGPLRLQGCKAPMIQWFNDPTIQRSNLTYEIGLLAEMPDRDLSLAGWEWYVLGWLYRAVLHTYYCLIWILAADSPSPSSGVCCLILS
jgi:hypothetical protein